MEVLHLLQTRPLSLRELSTELAKLCEVAFDDGWLKKIQGILLDLEKLSLVERKPLYVAGTPERAMSNKVDQDVAKEQAC